MPFSPATTTLLLPVPSTSAIAGEVQTVARPGTVCCHRRAGWAAEATLGVSGSAPSASTVNQVMTLASTFVIRSFGAAADLVQLPKWENLDGECRQLTLPGQARAVK